MRSEIESKVEELQQSLGHLTQVAHDLCDYLRVLKALLLLGVNPSSDDITMTVELLPEMPKASLRTDHYKLIVSFGRR